VALEPDQVAASGISVDKKRLAIDRGIYHVCWTLEMFLGSVWYCGLKAMVEAECRSCCVAKCMRTVDRGHNGASLTYSVDIHDYEKES
jgi:hypothetical protein